MTLFELIKITLDQLCTQGRQEYGDDLDKVVAQKKNYLSKSYQNLTSSDREPLNYQDPATRIAYVHCYVASHADYLVQIFNRYFAKYPEAIFNRTDVRLSCIGGGPGSDILALLKFLSSNTTSVTKLTCYLLDSEQAWADTWTELDDSISEGLNLKTNFQQLDVASPESWKYQKNFKNADIFTFSYFVSEVYNLGQDGAVDSFFSSLIEDAKPGALFVYIDNANSNFYGYFDSFCEEGGLQLLLSDSDTNFTPNYTEQASVLAEYTTRFGSSPKLKGNVAYRILQKPE